MTTSTARSFALPVAAPAAARAVFRLLSRLQTGTLDLQLPDGSQAHFGNGQAPRAALRLHDWRMCAARAQGRRHRLCRKLDRRPLEQPRPGGLLTLFIANREAVESAIYGSWWGSLAHRVKHLLNRNSRRGSRKNIHAHYDLGNAFYREWLDETMNYSSALFEGDLAQPMPQAQHAKVRRALRECGIQPGGRLLEIGCGWGALAEAAATDFGARVTGVTLSTEQLAYAQERVRHAGVRRPCGPAPAGLPRHRPTNPLTPLPASRCSKPWAASTGAASLPRCAASSSRAAGLHPDHHHPRRPVRALRAQHRLHPAVHLPGRPAAQPRALSRRGQQKAGLVWSTNWPSAPTTPKRCAAGAWTFWHATRRCGAGL
jgi:hypothetical protein